VNRLEKDDRLEIIIIGNKEEDGMMMEQCSF